MPELPEVETVRRGLASAVVATRIGTPRVAHDRAVRRQVGGAQQFAALAGGASVAGVGRRGKYLWLALDDAPGPIVAHLGMSGQFRLVDTEPVGDPHARVWWPVTGSQRDRWLVFRDQRTFGWVLADEWAGDVPAVVSHIARDPFDPRFDPQHVQRDIRRRRSAIKRVLLSQDVVSGIGNIYADEALWRVRLAPERAADSLSRSTTLGLLEAATRVMAEALAAGGTSFDPLYVSINGESGWFDRSLNVYGRAGLPCPRCETPIVRERFTNRSSHRCPRCQRQPRRR